MTDTLDFRVPAELFAGGTSLSGRRQPLIYRRFATFAEAVRHLLEEMPKSVAGVYIETDRGRYDAAAVKKAYDSHDYPFPRKA